MMMTIIEALSGLGIFLFGMLYMESALRDMAGIRLKRWIKNSTSTPLRAILSGAAATAALQSSSVVTLMTLSFVSASLISLSSGIAVIFGSNIGTTITAWIVATLGFKVNIELFALPLIGIGGLALIFGSSYTKVGLVAKAVIGFGLLFLGLDLMKSSIESAAIAIDLSLYIHLPLVSFVVLGFVITALIQSSSAATAITLSALYADILGFDQAAAMVIGTNIGTTVTALLGSIGGIPDKKRAAAAHLLFNLLTAMIAFSILPFTSDILMNVLSLRSDPIIALALFHTIFNVMGVVLLAPFIPYMASYLGRIFSHKEKMPTKYIHKVDPQVPDTALIALRDEANKLFEKTIKFILLLCNIKPSDILAHKRDIKIVVANNTDRIEFDFLKTYEKIKEVESDTMAFVNILVQQNLSAKQHEYLDILSSSVRESVYAAKIVKDIKNDLDDFSESENQEIVTIHNMIRKNLAYTINIFVNYMEKKYSQEKCFKKFTKAEEENRHILDVATALVAKDRRSKTMVVSLLNANHSAYICMKSLREASQSLSLEFLLEKDKE